MPPNPIQINDSCWRVGDDAVLQPAAESGGEWAWSPHGDLPLKVLDGLWELHLLKLSHEWVEAVGVCDG